MRCLPDSLRKAFKKSPFQHFEIFDQSGITHSYECLNAQDAVNEHLKNYPGADIHKVLKAVWDWDYPNH